MQFWENSFTLYLRPLQETADDLFACSIPDRNPQVTIKPPIGANIPNTDFKFNPILVSINAAVKIVPVENIAEINNGRNEV